jgi:hypothetical protein
VLRILLEVYILGSGGDPNAVVAGGANGGEGGHGGNANDGHGNAVNGGNHVTGHDRACENAGAAAHNPQCKGGITPSGQSSNIHIF